MQFITQLTDVIGNIRFFYRRCDDVIKRLPPSVSSVTSYDTCMLPFADRVAALGEDDVII